MYYIRTYVYIVYIDIYLHYVCMYNIEYHTYLAK